MNLISKWLIFFEVLTITNMLASAQSDSLNFNFDGTVRYRFEAWKGMNAKNYGDNSTTAIGKINDKILLQRFILGFNTSLKNKYNFSFHLQDSRAFGWSLRNSLNPDLFKIRKAGTEVPYYKMNPQEEFLEIYDLYFEAKQILKFFDIKFGRQKIAYGDYRIFGPGDWGNTGRWTWDALKISMKNEQNFIDVFVGGTKIHDPEKLSIPFVKTEFWGGGIYAHYEISNILNVEPFYAYKTAGSADYINTLSFHRNWVGLRLFKQNFHSFDFDVLCAYQFGWNENKPISAFGIFAKIGYSFKFLPGAPFLSIRESYASGGKSSDKIIHTFEPAFGATDKFYGWMNITSWSNLDDKEIVLEFFSNKKLWVEVKYNMFYIPVNDNFTLLSNLKLKPGKKHLGNEFDVFVKYILNDNWQFAGVIGYFEPKEVMDINNQKPTSSTMIALQVQYFFNKKILMRECTN